jgi:hypothetical protein
MAIKYQSPVFQTTRDVSHLNWWRRQLFWHVYVPFARFCHLLGLPTVVAPDGARIEIQTIASSEAVAMANVATLGENAFYIRHVPTDVMLPTSNVVFGGNRAPMSDAAPIYEQAGRRRESTLVLCPHTGDFCRPHESLKRSVTEVAAEMTKVTQALQTLKARV